MQENIKQYQTDSPQIKITPAITKIAENFKENNIDLILEILDWISRNIKTSETDKNKLFRKRTAEEIIESKIATGCTDYALAFIALTRAKDIPTKYVEAIRRRWLDIGEEDQIEGHIFAECFINNKWYIIDPQEGAIITAYRRHVIFAKGLDSWDIGIKSLDDLKKLFAEFKEKYAKEKNN